MTAYDYGPIAAKAVELVAKFGSTVTLVNLGATAADPTKPWASVSTSGKTTKTYSAVRLEPTSYAQLGLKIDTLDFLKQSSAVYIIATGDDLTGYHKLIDADGVTYSIMGLTQMKPGATTLLYYLGVGS